MIRNFLDLGHPEHQPIEGFGGFNMLKKPHQNILVTSEWIIPVLWPKQQTEWRRKWWISHCCGVCFSRFSQSLWGKVVISTEVFPAFPPFSTGASPPICRHFPRRPWTPWLQLPPWQLPPGTVGSRGPLQEKHMKTTWKHMKMLILQSDWSENQPAFRMVSESQRDFDCVFSRYGNTGIGLNWIP